MMSRSCLHLTQPRYLVGLAYTCRNSSLPVHTYHLSPLSSPSTCLQPGTFSIHTRSLATSPTAMSSPSGKKDWSATQYLKFHDERTRPVHDLIAQVARHMSSPTPRIYDLGCGPGNSTKALLTAFPGSQATGLDTSADMLLKARSDAQLSSQGATFLEGDISTWTPPPGEGVDLVFSNAVFHWLRHAQRIPTLKKLFGTLSPGAVLAIQVPDNYHAPSHALMRATASQTDKPYSKYFASTRIGDLDDVSRPDLDPIESPTAFYDALLPEAASVDVWRTEYQHVLSNVRAIVEWVKGTGLQPYLHMMQGDESAQRAFLNDYEELLSGAYGKLKDGRVVLGYMRLFVVAVKK